MPDPVTGLKQAGNVNLYTRPHVRNPDGGMSTVKSMSFGDEKGETLVPGISNTSILEDDEAIQQYRQTGQHLGVFDTPENATAYAQKLHQAYESGALDVPLATSRKGVDPNRLGTAVKGLVESGPYAIPRGR